MKKVAIFFTLYLIVNNYSCTNDTKEIRKTLVFKYQNGIKSQISCLIKGEDTLFDGVGAYYYPNGKIMDEVKYVMNKKNDYQLHYDSLGRIESKIMYKNDIIEGDGFFYGTNGRLYILNKYIKGKIVFTESYYDNGQRKSYTVINDSLPFYSIGFDSMGAKKWEKGYAFALSNSCFSFNPDSVRTNTLITVMIPVAAIPGYLVKLGFAKFDSIGNMIESTDSIPIVGYYARLMTSFDKPGVYQLGIAGRLTNDKSEIIRNDTLAVHLRVVK